jgi:hypothetical protein
MEYLGAIIVALIGVLAILIRNPYTKFIVSFLRQVPGLKGREEILSRWISRTVVVLATGFILFGVFLAINIASNQLR